MTTFIKVCAELYGNIMKKYLILGGTGAMGTAII
jgi:hypothetical protein